MYALKIPSPAIKPLVRLYNVYLTFAQHKHQTAKEVEYAIFLSKGELMGMQSPSIDGASYLWNATYIHLERLVIRPTNGSFS